MKQKISSILRSPAKAFAVLGVIFGILFIFITPPFQVADEYNHFYRAFQISQLQIIAVRQQNSIGGLLPTSLVKTAEKVSQDLGSHPENKQKLETIFSLLNLPLESSNKIFVEFPNTALYSPIPYLPQAIGIALGKFMGTSPIILMYMGRIANLLVWLLLVYLSLQIIPGFKWLFFLLALTPMSLFQAASVSADAVTNSLSFLWIALILKYAFTPERKKNINNYNIGILLLISVLLSLCKTAYFFLILLYLLIPKIKLGNSKKYFISVLLLFLLNAAAVILWSSLTKNFVISPPNVYPREQLFFILTHPWKYIQVIINTMAVYGDIKINEFIGVLGWLDTPIPNFHIRIYLVILFIVALGIKPQNLVISHWQKLILFITFIVTSLVIMTLLYLSWTPVGNDTIEGLQGRYFIPISSLAFILLSNNRIKFNIEKMIRYKTAYSLYSLFVLYSCTLTATTLLQRYYF